MLVPKEEPANAARDDPPSTKFTWTIENFSRFTGKKLYSDVFFVGGYKWRVLMYPKGNGVDHLSMYLEVADSITLRWSRYARFSLTVVNQIRRNSSRRKDTQHEFNAQESDWEGEWGFTTFMPLSELYDPSKGYLLNDTCIVEADVAVVPISSSVAPAEAADAPIVNDPPSARFTWTIDNFSRLTRKKLYSDVFFVGGYKWRVLMYPKGNDVDHLSMYLELADSITLRWSRYARFSLTVVNQIHRKFSRRKDTLHEFNGQEIDWGFTTFMPLSELYDPSKGYLLNDTCIVEADVVIEKVVNVVT